jgi:perosamine synthetase
VTSTSFEPGAPFEGGIPLCVPSIGGREWEYVKDCLDSGWVSSVGSYVTRFEKACASVTGTEHAVATINGTSALHVALLAAGVEPDDEVLVPTLTFIAPANAVRYVGAWPVFIDAEPAYWQIDPGLVGEFLSRDCSFDGTVTRNKATGRRVRAILPVDVLGHPVDLDPLVELAHRFSLAIVEDATESLAARYKGSPIGAQADVTCLSFNGNKLVTTGGGGMIVTNDRAVAERARYLTTQAKDDAVEYVHGAIGYNYRLTNVLAAIGCGQLEHLDDYVAIKRKNAARYAALLADVPGLRPMREAPWATSTFWLFTVLVDAEAFGASSRALLRILAEQGIQTRPLWQPLHRSPAHHGARCVESGVAERLYRDALSLPSSVELTAEQLETVARAVASGAKIASRA